MTEQQPILRHTACPRPASGHLPFTFSIFQKTSRYIGILLFLATQFELPAQKDTTYQTIHQESGEFVAPIVETPADRVFRTRVPSKWMFKLNLGPSVNFNDNSQFRYRNSSNGVPVEVGVEYKLSPVASIGAYYGMKLGYQSTDDFLDEGEWLYSSSLAVEGRWYHDIKKRIRSGHSANNFGGRYLALEASLLNNSTVISPIIINKLWKQGRLSLRYGLQHRFLRNGYFDVSIGVGISDQYGIIKLPKIFSTDQRVAVGLAAFAPKPKMLNPITGVCDVLHCQDELYNMFKINLLNVLSFQSDGSNHNFDLQPNIAFERKIGRSPFSVELDLVAAFNSSKYIYYNIFDRYSARYTSAKWNATGELRWYYNMRKRILKGRSGNNLSGTFIGLQLNRNNLIKSLVSIEFDGPNSITNRQVIGDYWTGNFVWGIQQRLFSHGFIQFKIGAGSTFGGNNYIYREQNKQFVKIGRENELNIIADLKVGFAF